MSAQLNYIIEANTGLLLFLAVYKLLLNRETNFGLQRVLLLLGIFASVSFPLIHLQNNQDTSSLSIASIVPSYWLDDVVVGGEAAQGAPGAAFGFLDCVSLIYMVGVAIGGFGVLLQLLRLTCIIHKAKSYRLQDLRIAESGEHKATFSFFHFIFIGKANLLSVNEKQQIIRHESVHARQWHSFDILVLSLLKIFFWFNPLINLYRKTLVQLHEFEADAFAVKNCDVNKYCSLLAKVALQSTDVNLASYFNNTLTIKRIAMIRSIKNKTSLWKIALCMLMIPLSFLLLSCQDQFRNEGEGSDQVSVVDEAATPEGGMQAFYNLMRKNIRYPSEARADHISGNVAVQFVVNEDGSLSDFEILQSPDQILGDEALRILRLSRKWNPAKKSGAAVKHTMVLPIVFELDYPGSERKKEQEKVNIPKNASALSEIVVVGYSIK